MKSKDLATKEEPIVNQAIMLETIRNYGINYQLTVAIEEMAELTQVITKYKRGNILDREHLVEEFSDVTYMMAQLQYIFNIDQEEINKAIASKQERQLRRMIDGK